MFTEIKEMDVAIQIIKPLIGDLQVNGYKVHIDNYCIGDFHNINIHKYTIVTGKLLNMLSSDELYKLEPVYHNQIRLPSESEKLIEVLVELYNKETK